MSARPRGDASSSGAKPPRAASVRPIIGLAIPVLAAALLAGCGNLTAGGFGELEVLVAADSVGASAALDSASSAMLPAPPAASFGTSAASAPPRPERGAAGAGAQVDGTLTFSVRVFAVDSEGAQVEITEGERDVSMALTDAPPVVLARRPLAAGRYVTIRTVFLSVVAVVEGGLVVDGEPVRGPVTVELGPDHRLVVDAPVDLTIMDDDAARIAIDLHATRWLRLLQSDRQVRSTDFSGEVRVRQRP